MKNSKMSFLELQDRIDRKGSHFLGNCNREHMAGHRHNKIRDIFAQVLSNVGAQVITEPAQFLDQGLKPDIEAHVALVMIHL